MIVHVQTPILKKLRREDYYLRPTWGEYPRSGEVVGAYRSGHLGIPLITAAEVEAGIPWALGKLTCWTRQSQ